MAAQSDGRSARDILEGYGRTIQQQAKKDAEQRAKDLEGDLSKVEFVNDEKTKVTNPCQLDYNYETSVSTGHSHPCEGRQGVRFSDTKGAECYWSRIKGSEKNSGACAPFRKLHMCDKNLENIDPGKIKSTHNLLVDVLLAAKHEGQSLVDNHKEYKQQNNDSDTHICTALARSFADIGDIIRGKDLFLGHKQRKNQLEERLKTMFANIQNENQDLTTLKPEEVREYWWALNRDQVWKAITCDAGVKDTYSINTGNGITSFDFKCGHEDKNVATNLDYVPQYLRWFQEWAEDFCTKRKHKLKDAIQKCRGQYQGKERYCDLNGYDCKGTARGKNKYKYEHDCIECSFSCIPFTNWIDNQKLEFLKQKEKYDKEILQKNKRTITTRYGTINNVYAKEFYDKLEEEYKTVDKFLELLNKETTCKGHPKVEEKSHIDFNEKIEKTFSHTTYCQACPWCGVEPNGPPWQAKPETECRDQQIKKFDDKNSTKIDLLVKDKGGQTMMQKLKSLCNDSSNKNIQKWKCHYEGAGKDYCVLQNDNKNTTQQEIVSFNSLFWRWVTEMLKDSIDWRKEHENCMKKGDISTCKKGCKNKCDCFEKWVKRMKKEWDQIEQHYVKEHFEGFGAYWTLGYLLKEYFTKIKDAYPGVKSVQEFIKEMEQIIEENSNNIKATRDDNSIKELLEYEKGDAQKCVTNNPEKCEDTPGVRSLDPDSDEDFSEDEEPPPEEVENPCANPSGIKHPVLATKVAHQMQQKAHQKMIENSVKNSEIGKGHGKGGGKNVKSSLIGDISKAQFKDGTKANGLTEEVCDITDQHTNESRSAPNGGPCKNKGKGLDIGTKWNDRTSQSSTPNVYVRPRREHMCTSNLEHLETDQGPLNKSDGKVVNDSFLGDVLLSAKYEAEKIKELYEKNKDQSGHEVICRAIRYSFADIGDIIRGRDLWDRDSGSTDMETRLKNIFKKIKEQIPEIHDKYKDDENKTPPYKQLREDWWEANRRQVWNAMTCPTKNGITCDGSPYEDYIPQRLRWMTEWAEWYCKMQSQEYENLVNVCNGCKDKGDDCRNNSAECSPCKEACEAYRDKIKKWEEQWQQMQLQYLILYHLANTTGPHGINSYGGAVGEKDKPVVQFLEELQKANGVAASDATKSPYATADRYIHQEIGNVGCNIQNEFCFKKNGSGGKVNNNEKYAFKYPPPDYVEACKCMKREAPPKETTTTQVNVCDIVKNALADMGSLTQACQQKYDGKYYGWRGVNTTGSAEGEAASSNPRVRRSAPGGEKSGAGEPTGGSICIPPRRRKLYVGGLTKLTSAGTSSESSQGGSEASQGSPPATASQAPKGDPLLTAFVESAAIETFFLWHKYKAENSKTQSVGSLQPLNGDSVDGGEQNPQTQLKSGTIPPDFLRQMFYTLADYRDILFRKNDIVIGNTGSDSTKDEMSQREEKIKGAIQTFFQNGDKKTAGVSSQTGQTPDKWWNQNAKHIWHGMICALTHKTETPGDVDEKVKKAFFGDKGTSNEPIETYKYDQVKLKEEVNGAKTNESPTLLSEFVKRPTYFRYLEEWGQHFCTERKKRLGQIHKDCKVEESSGSSRRGTENPKCSCYGEDCKKMREQDYDILPSFYCPSCANSCSSYKKWINTKKTQYEKQKEAYTGQKDNYVKESNMGAESNNHDNGFHKTLENYKEAKDFLKTLASCKKDNGVGKPIFDKETETFGPATNCKPCPKFKTNCQNGDCKGANGNTCNAETITADAIGKMDNSTVIDMLVSDDNTNGFDGDLDECVLGNCADVDIFKGFRKDVWTCGNVCGVDICEQTNVNRGTDGKEYIQIRALLRLWLEYFLDDYNKIKHKISHCTNNGNGSSCIRGCKDKCKCVGEWINKKRTEWQKIRDRYVKQYKNEDGDDDNYKVKHFLEDLQSQIDATINKAIKPCGSLTAFENSSHCNGTAGSKKSEEEKKKDVVLCLIEKLEKKISECKNQHSGEETETA
ncbi:hypothetical protein PFFVO_06002, partial [Plasmodium falciparum Vietnam Oak-Knoll (FVO)]